MMKTTTLYFSECEHDGDLSIYLHDIKKSGGKVIDSRIDYDEETAIVDIEVDDIQKFNNEFKDTDSYDFCENL